jgi:hypothetical protein
LIRSAAAWTSSRAQRIADFRISPDVQVRVDILADRAENGLLSDEERAEYESLINAAGRSINTEAQGRTT